MKHLLSKRIFTLCLCLALCLSALYLPVIALGDDAADLPGVAPVKGVSVYTNPDNNTLLTAQQAAAAGVPAGYTGSVIKLEGTSDAGITLDYSAYNIPISMVEALDFRVYTTSSVREVRVTKTAGSGWIMRYADIQANAWDDIRLHVGGLNLFDNASLTDLANADGNLGVFELGFRLTAKTTVYVDSVSVVLKSGDKVAPVISYSGSTTVNWSAGKPFTLDGASAHDAFEDRDIPLTYEWSDGALGKDGTPVKGTHTCTVSATDFSGNRATVKLTVKVGDKDTEAPVIHCDLTTLHALTGSVPYLSFTATDNYDPVEVELAWSSRAFDDYHRLRNGNHTLTLTCTDRSGNTATKTIKVTVAKTAEKVNNTIDESK